MNITSDGREKIIKLEQELQLTKHDLMEVESYIQEFNLFLPLPVCTVNPIGVIINVNKSFEDLTGFKAEEIISEFIEKFFFEKEEVGKIKEEIEEKGSILKEELTLISKQEKKIPASVSVAARKDKEENFIGYFMGISDMTEVKRLQRGLEEKIGELERFNKVMMGRELKMIELKKEIEELKKK